MNKEKVIVISAVFLIFLFAFIFNIQTTGSVTYIRPLNPRILSTSSTSISIFPNNITPGDKINITIEPGKKGIYRYITFHKKNGLKRGITSFCGSNFKCFDKKSVTYITSTSWEPNDYYIRVYDYTKNDYLYTNFKVISLEQDCKNKGGKWEVRLSSYLPSFCNMPTSDAGKTCTDGGQCDKNYCIGTNMKSKYGKCAEWKTIVGCYYFIWNNTATKDCIYVK